MLAIRASRHHTVRLMVVSVDVAGVQDWTFPTSRYNPALYNP
jgi:hypothetical protein